MAVLVGLVMSAVGVFFFVNSTRFAQAAVRTSNRRYGTPIAGWLRFHTWQNRLVSAVFVVAGVLLATGVIDLEQ